MDSKLRLIPAKYFLLRRPLLPVNSFFDINQLANSDKEEFTITLLKRYEEDPMLMEAIYTASPELYYQLCKVIRKEEAASSKLILTLYKYLSRMSTRCTPYGLFAGCSTGATGAKTQISYDQTRHIKHSRLDMNYVNELVDYLQLIPEVRKKLTFFVNSSLYASGDHYRYIEYKIQNKKRVYTLAAVRKSEHLNLLIHAAEKGILYPDLLDLLFTFDSEIDLLQGEEFIEELIQSQLLISELEPTITGEIFMEKLLGQLQGKASAEIISLLEEIDRLLKVGGIAAFEEVYQIINENFVKCQSKDLIQTDLFFEHEQGTLNEGIAGEITSQLAELYKLSAKGNVAALETFKQKFLERYEDREVSLLQVLDAESGINYGSGGKSDNLPLVEGLNPKTKKAAPSTTWSAQTLLVNKLFKRAANDGTTSVELTSADLDELEDQPELQENVPASLYAFGSFIASSAGEMDNGNYKFSLSVCSGPSSANILGRFCHGDKQLYKNVVETLEADEPDNEETVYAEVVHLPESRIGNILVRPKLRKYEIPFLGKSSCAIEDQIKVQDLMVSIKNGKVVLRSRKLNKIVIPRLSTAHNYMNGLAVYRFLCDLQKEGSYHSIFWGWDNLSDSSFLPRVVYKKIILSKATWKINRLSLKNFGNDTDQNIEILNKYMDDLKVPQYVCIAEHDNELLVDRTNYLGKDLLYHEIKKKGAIKLIEFLFQPEDCFLNQNGGGHFSNEFLLPVSNKKVEVSSKKLPVQNILNTQRVFLPGSEWIYMKIYGGTKSTERFLVETVCPYLKDLVENQLINEWFFIRYTDPNHHIRLRLRLPSKDPECNAIVISGLYNLFSNDIEQDGLYRVQLDTYIRELERYGHNNIENSESLFYHDSVAITNILNMIEGDEGEHYRWLLCVRGLNELLTDFGLTLEDKIKVAERLSNAFFIEHNGEKMLNQTLNDKYRNHSKSIRSFLDSDNDIKNEISEATHEFSVRSKNTKEIIGNILALYDHNILSSNQGFMLLSSYVHMYLNRFFPSKARQHELVAYTLMKKYYLSVQAIEKSQIMKLN